MLEFQTITQMKSITDGQTLQRGEKEVYMSAARCKGIAFHLRSPTKTCNTASKKGIHLNRCSVHQKRVCSKLVKCITYVDMLKSAALNKPAVMKPNTAEPVTAPARLRMRNVIKTMRANVTLDRLSFGFGGFGSWINGTADIGAMVES